MLTVDTVADIDEDGTVTVRTPARGSAGKRRVVLVMDEDPRQLTASASASLPDLSDFRTQLQGKSYPGSSAADFRDRAYTEK